ncbi:MAG: S-layer homology domain-containing protein [Lachnospiraceae bacterium]|nr:S-layer homology domain-containing protein [Lachnospiraceae bacterium]
MKRKNGTGRLLALLLCTAFLLSGCGGKNFLSSIRSGGDKQAAAAAETADAESSGPDESPGGEKMSGGEASEKENGKELSPQEACPPDQAITRAQFLAVLAKQFQYDPEDSGSAFYVDVPKEHWAYPYVAAGTSRGILKGQGSAFYPDARIDRATAVTWAIRASGIYMKAENPYRDVTDEETAWAVSVAAAKGFVELSPDGLFHPEAAVTGAEAEKLIGAAAADKEQKFQLRPDASNTVELQDRVQCTRSDSETNQLAGVEAAARRLTLRQIDDTVRGLQPGDVLYLEPSGSFPEGFLGKIDSIQVEGDQAVMVCSQPQLAEVIKEIDISTTFAVGAANYRNDGDLLPEEHLDRITERIQEQEENRRRQNQSREAEGTSASVPATSQAASTQAEAEQTSAEESAAASSEGSGEGTAASTSAAETSAGGPKTETQFETFGYGDSSVTHHNGRRIWSAFGGAGVSSSVVFTTPDYEKKKGFYARLSVLLDVSADIHIIAENLDITYFSLATKVDSQVHALAGYQLGGSASPSMALPTCVIPISGPLSLQVKPYLKIYADGKMVVEATADLTNTMGFFCAYYEDFDVETVNDTNVNVTFTADAEGKLEFGPEFDIDLQLCGTPFFDGAALLNGKGFMGAGISGKTSVKQQVSVSNDSASYQGHQNTPDADGNLHVCYLCIQGEAYMVDRLTIGVGSTISEPLKKLTDKELSMELPEIKHTLTPWHYSAGKDYGPEFELKKCPHIAYPVTFTALEKETEEPIQGAEITITKEDGVLTTDSEGTAKTWLENGVYSLSAVAEGYTPEPLTGVVTVPARKVSKALYFEPELEGVVISGSIAEYQGVTYICSRDVPGLTALPVEAAKYDYICEFAFYENRLYYCCKTAGTSEISSAIYSCKLDGSDLKQVADYQFDYQTRTATGLADCTSFVILDRRLYHGYHAEACVDLETGESRKAELAIDRWAERCRDSRAKYQGEYQFYVDGSKNEELHQVKDGEDKIIYRHDKYMYLVAATESYIYFSDTRGNDGYLRRLNRNTGAVEELAHHGLAGGGPDPFFNW